VPQDGVECKVRTCSAFVRRRPVCAIIWTEPGQQESEKYAHWRQTWSKVTLCNHGEWTTPAVAGLLLCSGQAMVYTVVRDAGTPKVEPCGGVFLVLKFCWTKWVSRNLKRCLCWRKIFSPVWRCWRLLPEDLIMGGNMAKTDVVAHKKSRWFRTLALESTNSQNQYLLHFAASSKRSVWRPCSNLFRTTDSWVSDKTTLLRYSRYACSLSYLWG